MAEEVFMQIPTLRGYVKQFSMFGNLLNGISKMLDWCIMTLRATAFIGLVGGAAAAQYIDMINRQNVKPLAQNCAAMARELGKSIDAYERGDAQGATLFY